MLLLFGRVKAFWQRPFAKVDDRASQDMPRGIDVQSCTTIPIEEAQTKLAPMCVNPTFANARDRMLPHEDWDVLRQNIQQLAEQCAVNQEGVIANANPLVG